MSTNEEDEKIVRARLLLKKFQTKQSRRSSVNESDAASAAVLDVNVFLDNSLTVDGNGDPILQQCSRSSTPISTKAKVPTTMNHDANELRLHNRQPQIDKCQSLPKIVSTKNDDIASLQIVLSRKQQEFNELQAKHQELHSHYAELHSAYDALFGQHGKNQTYLEQIQQLRLALSVAMEEKKSLQNDYRGLEMDFQKFKAAEEQNSSSIHTAEGQQHLRDSMMHHELGTKLNRLLAERDHLRDTVASQSAQIEQQRRECSSIEAKLVLMQQDRIDAQGRIKGMYSTKTQLEQTIEQQRSELTMRDIYIKQLTRQQHGSNSDCGRQPDDNNQQQKSIDHDEDGGDEIRHKHADELEWHRSKVVELQKQLQLVQEQHQAENAQSNANAKRLVDQLDSMKSANAHLETCNNLLEERLQILQQQKSLSLVDAASAGILSPSIHNINENCQDDGTHQNLQPKSAADQLDELDRLLSAVKELTTENEQMAIKLRDTELLMQQKDHNFDQLQQSLAETQFRVAHFEQLQNIQSTIKTDASLLSEQLQNEKATVSRAVTQNVELKSQLKELQDRLIAVMNESVAKEDERLTALATVERLRQQLNGGGGIDEKIGKNVSAVEAKVSHKTNGDDNLSSADQPIFEMKQAEASTRTAPITDSNNIINNNKSLCDIGLQTDHQPERMEQIDTDMELCNDNTIVAPLPVDEPPNLEQQQQQQLTISSTIPNLVTQMEALSRENARYRSANERLEYWLTALESENESIGEYIALYRFQRTQIQQRIAEKDAALQQLQQQNAQLTAVLSELRNALLSVMPKNLARNADDNDDAKDEQSQHSRLVKKRADDGVDDDAGGCADLTQLQQHQQQQQFDAVSTGRLMRILERSEAISRQVSCMAAHQAQIHCTGCVECQGELFNL